MVSALLKLYDWLKSHRAVWMLLLAASLALMIWRASSLGYKEDIYDFLPVDNNGQKALGVYQNISSADRLFVIFRTEDGTTDRDRLVEAADRFATLYAEADTTLTGGTSLVTEIDFEQFVESAGELYANIPYLLTREDYARLDSLLTPQYIAEQIRKDKTLLMLPTGSLLSGNLPKDPLNIFTPTVAKLQDLRGGMAFDIYDGHIFSPDGRMVISMLSTPFGSSETARNTKLVRSIESNIATTEAEIGGVSGHVTGAPAIAVGNASQIKRDSIIAIVLALVLILALLFYTFGNLRNIVLIVVSIAWGALFAMSAISFIHTHISIIVLGISSVIIGIAVNYPLHLIAHLKHTATVRDTLREIVIPLSIGNITTVGAFLCLVPLEAPALKDLGLFGAFMLVGTIIFVCIFLPHLAGTSRPHSSERQLFTERLSALAPRSGRTVVLATAILTAILAYFSQYTAFDTDLRNINYMTAEQKADFAMLQAMDNGNDGTTLLYILSEGETPDAATARSEQIQAGLSRLADEAVIAYSKSITPFIPSIGEQKERLALWHRLTEDKRELLGAVLDRELEANGFNTAAFAPFREIVDGEYEPDSSLTDRLPVLASLAEGYTSRTADGFAVVDMVSVPAERINEAKAAIAKAAPEAFCFDIREINGSIANSLTNEFNYIGFSCGLIVFVFLWLSFGRLELSIIAFMPMAISWVWILGLMGLADIRFNIVNVILATFIFGQGDDYTIFITEGLIHERTYGKKMLASYKNSIFISALIMFAGIGTLIIAKHPALRSLAQITIIGMFSVVFTACFMPPVIFRWLTLKNGEPRRVPLTLGLLCSRCCVYAEAAAGALLRMFQRDKEAFTQRFADRAARFNRFITAGRNEGFGYTDTKSGYAIVDAIDAARDRLCARDGKARYYRCFIRSRYFYKGPDTERSVSRMLKKLEMLGCGDNPIDARSIVVINNGCGVAGLLLALTHPQMEVLTCESDPDTGAISLNCTHLPSNLHINIVADEYPPVPADAALFLIKPTVGQRSHYESHRPTVIE